MPTPKEHLTTSQYSFALLGATGSTGLEIIDQLSMHKQCRRMLICSRRKPESKKLKHFSGEVSFERISSGDSLTQLDSALNGCDILISALGTTRKAQKSAEDFRRVDLELNLNVAKIARKVGVRHMVIVSAKGANRKLPLLKARLFHPFLYLQTKGELEARLQELTFPSLSIYRPGLLHRHRGEKRFSEHLARTLLPALSTKNFAKKILDDSIELLEKPEGPSPVVQVFEERDCYPKKHLTRT